MYTLANTNVVYRGRCCCGNMYSFSCMYKHIGITQCVRLLFNGKE
jgi:hypothetical protein